MFEPAERVLYREAWWKLQTPVYNAVGHACPRCPGKLCPFGPVLPPHATAGVRSPAPHSVPLLNAPDLLVSGEI
jgi:hypothetical protein